MEQLLQTELLARQERTKVTLLEFAGLPAVKMLEQYDFVFATGAPTRTTTRLS
jgi:hypothetical protein